MFLRALFCCTLVVIDLQTATLQLIDDVDEETEDQEDISDVSEEKQAPQGLVVVVQHPTEGSINQSPIPAVSLQEVQRLAASLQNVIRNLQDRDQKDAQFALSMVSQYPWMTVSAQKDLYQRLHVLFIAAQGIKETPLAPESPPEYSPPVWPSPYGPPVWPTPYGPPESPPVYSPPVWIPPYGPPEWPTVKGPPVWPPAYGPPERQTAKGPPVWPPAYGPPEWPPAYGPPEWPPAYGPPEWPPAYGPSEWPPVYDPPVWPPVYGPPVWPSVYDPPLWPPVYGPPVWPTVYVDPTKQQQQHPKEPQQQPQQQPQEPQEPPQPLKTDKCKDSAKPKLLICEYRRVSITDLSTNDNKRLSVDKEFEFYYSIDYHFNKSLVFYSYKDYLFWGHLRGTDSISDSKLLSRVDGYTKAVVDWVNDKVYFATQHQSTVKMADLDGSNVRTLFDIHLNVFPDNLAMDPYFGRLFFVTIGYIYSCNLNGRQFIRIQLDDGKHGRVRDLTLDIYKKRVYFTYVVGDNVDISKAIWNYDINDGKEVRLASDSYIGWGSGKDHPMTKKFGDMRTIQVFRGTVYFADYAGDEGSTVWSVDLAQNPAVPVKVYSTTHSIDSIKVYHPSVQNRSDTEASEVHCP